MQVSGRLDLPVIGLKKKGGAVDIIEDGINGVFFEEQTVESLTEAIERFEKLDWSAERIMESAEKFTEAEFTEELRKVVESRGSR